MTRKNIIIIVAAAAIILLGVVGYNMGWYGNQQQTTPILPADEQIVPSTETVEPAAGQDSVPAASPQEPETGDAGATATDTPEAPEPEGAGQPAQAQ